MCYIWGFSILGVLIHASKSQTYAFKTVDSSKITQIKEEWSKLPFVDIKAVKLNLTAGIIDCPADYPSEVLQSYWAGMTWACNCNAKTLYSRRIKPRVDGTYLPDDWSDKKPNRYTSFKKNSFRMDRACRRGRKSGENGCDNSWAEPAIVMNNLNGYKLCGKRGG